MPNGIDVVLTGKDTGAARVVDNLTASSRAAKKQAEETAKAQKLAAAVLAESGSTVTEASRRIVRSREEERIATANLSKVQTALRKGYLDEATGTKAAAAAYQQLAKARLEAAEAAKVEQKMSAGHLLRARVTEHLGEFGISEGMAGTAVAAAAGVVALGELANKMREAVSETLELGEQMDRASQKTGLAVETLSVLRYAARTTGGDFDSMASAVAKMDKGIGLAAEGNKQALGLMKALNLNAKELAATPQGAEIAWRRFVEVMGATASPIARATLAQQLLGKAGAEQIPTIIELATHWDELSKKAAETGNVMSGQTARQLAETNQKLKDLKMSIAGASVAFTEGFTPAFSQVLDVMAGGQSHLDMFKHWGEEVGRGLEFAASAAYGLAGGLAKVLEVQARTAKIALEVQSLGLLPKSVADRYDQRAQAAGQFGDEALRKSREMFGLGVQEHKPETTNSATPADKPSAAGFQIPDLSNTADKAAQKRLKQMEADLAQEKLQYGMSVRAEYEYWDARRNAFAVGSEQYNAVLEKEAALAVEAARSAHEKIEAYRKSELADDRRMDAEKLRAMEQAQRALYGMAKDRYTADQERTREAERVSLEQMQGADRIREFNLAQSATAQVAAQQMQAMHQAEAQRQLTVLANDRGQAQKNPYLTEAEREKQIAAIDEQIERLHQSTELQALEDQKRIESTTLMGGMNDAIRDFVREATDAGAQMRQLFSKGLTSTNDAIVKYLTEPSSETRGRHIFGQVGHDLSVEVAGAALKGMEGNVMKMLGLGAPAKHDGSSEANAMWVKLVNAAGLGHSGLQTRTGFPGMPHLPGMPEYGDGGPLKDIWTGFHIPDVQPESGDGSQGGGMLGLMAKIGGFFGLGKKSQVSETGGGGFDLGALFGMGGKGNNGSSPSSPLYVKDVSGGGAGAGGGLGSLLGGLGGSSDSGGGDGGGGFASLFGGMFGGGGGAAGAADAGGGSMFGSLLAGLTGMFAEGTDFAPGGMALVGEKGPEIVNLPRGSQVVPNKRIGDFGGGGSHTHHYHIDARGATDPAAVEAATHRAIDRRKGEIQAGAIAQMMDMQRRVPAGRR